MKESHDRQEAEKKKKGEKETKKPRIITTQQIIGKERTMYLGDRPTKLEITPGKEGYRCLYCSLPYMVLDANTEKDQWVTCKACRYAQYKIYIEKATKCKCGAPAPKNK